ncbi:MAG: hypothetical protein HGA65_21060, partial [Oscillochloris sp.]|nr:hypothetical protein [Oscillochloris sp.]
MTTTSALRKLLITGMIASLLAIVSGGFVSATDSAAACTAWPLCSEALANLLSVPIWLSIAHRALVLIALVIVVLSAFIAWQRRDADPWLRWPLLATPLLIGLLSALGGLMVMLQLYKLVDLWHLALALLVLSSQVVPLVALYQPQATPPARMGARAASEARHLRALAWWSAGGVGVMVLALSARGLSATGLQAASGLPINAGGALAISAMLSGGMLWRLRQLRKGDMLLL